MTCSACWIAWKIVSCFSASSVPMPAAAEGQRWAMWSILCSCRQMARDQVDLDLVAGGQAADQVAAGLLHGLGDRQDRRDVVAGVGVVGRQEGVVQVELAHRGAVRPGRPFRREALRRRHAEDGGAALLRGWPSAMARAETTGRRLTEAMATEALSMIRLMIIACTSFSTATLSAATPAIFQASWSSRFSSDLDGWSLTGCICMAGVVPPLTCVRRVRVAALSCRCRYTSIPNDGVVR